MANLIVHNINEATVTALKARARLEGTSVEAEDRKILVEALLKPAKRGFAEIIACFE